MSHRHRSPVGASGSAIFLVAGLMAGCGGSGGSDSPPATHVGPAGGKIASADARAGEPVKHRRVR